MLLQGIKCLCLLKKIHITYNEINEEVCMMDIKENKSIKEIISETPLWLKVLVCFCIIPAWLNDMYDLGYLFGNFLSTF